MSSYYHVPFIRLGSSYLAEGPLGLLRHQNWGGTAISAPTAAPLNQIKYIDFMRWVPTAISLVTKEVYVNIGGLIFSLHDKGSNIGHNFRGCWDCSHTWALELKGPSAPCKETNAVNCGWQLEGLFQILHRGPESPSYGSDKSTSLTDSCIGREH